jgi:hypothetical protein
MKTREEYIALISKTFFSHENTKEKAQKLA